LAVWDTLPGVGAAVSRGEREGLVHLLNAIPGLRWNLNSVDPCDSPGSWTGVICNGSTSITYVCCFVRGGVLA
jgi:hypothetical protein